MIRFIIALSLLTGLPVYASSEFNPARAHSNYQIFCQGCHSPKGGGYRGVPAMQGFIGNFLTTQQGREYLVQVPGSANSTLNDEQLAEVLNWIVLEFADNSTPQHWERYSANEVGQLRKTPLMEVLEYRKKLVKSLPINNSSDH